MIPLAFKFLLAVASVVAYAVIAQVAPMLEGYGFPSASGWAREVIGALFGALVLAPYAVAQQRPWRWFALVLASILIYELAVWFVTGAPVPFDAFTSFVIAGSGAALLAGLAVSWVAPRPLGLRLVVLMTAAGALGGLAFGFRLPFDPDLILCHAAWQLLVCFALHAGLRPPITSPVATSSSAS